ncbi:MAG TPA: DNA helicase UvrD, partial [Candidatus Aerophobetes bacterium]|nr:DNA helicase UvrD [Candidatus Aerophobetes bacterium]
MSFIADFHIHSKYSRATSRDMEIPNLDKAAQIKGIDLVGTGDFTHPFWRAHLKKFLSPVEEGIYRYKRTFFILTSEVSSIFYRNGKLRKIHIVIFAPDFEVVEKVSEKLGKFGDLYSDGRPTLKLDARDLVRIVLDVSDRCL